MYELYFGPNSDLEGFNASDTSSQTRDIACSIREFLQNSLDAKRQGEIAEVDISVKTIAKKDIPCLEEYEKALESAIEAQKKANSYGDNPKNVVRDIRDALEKDEIKIMSVVDDGEGLPPDGYRTLLSQRSNKGGDFSGSYGVGHLSAFGLSQLRYILYASSYKEGEDLKYIFSGLSILAGHGEEDNPRSARGRIVLEKPEDSTHGKFAFPAEKVEFPEFIQDLIPKDGTGTVVVVLGFNNEWSTDAQRAVLINFFYALNSNCLSIKVHNGDNKLTVIDNGTLPELLKSIKDAKRPKSGEIITGEAAYQMWQACGENSDAKERYIELADNQVVKVHMLADDSIDKSYICLVRNGILIARHDSMASRHITALRDLVDREKYYIVIVVEKKDARCFYNLIRQSESPHHDKLVPEGLSEKKKECFKKYMKDLADGIQAHMEEENREQFVSEFFSFKCSNDSSGKKPRSEKPVFISASVKGGGHVGERDPQAEKTSPRNSLPRTQKKYGRPIKPGDATPIGEVATRVSYKGEHAEAEFHLHVTTKEVNNPGSVLISFFIAEENDSLSRNKRTEFRCKTFSMNGKGLEPSGNVVKLGELVGDTSYKLVAVLEIPRDWVKLEPAIQHEFGAV